MKSQQSVELFIGEKHRREMSARSNANAQKSTGRSTGLQSFKRNFFTPMIAVLVNVPENTETTN